MTINEVTSIVAVISTLIIATISAFYKQSSKISKLQAHSDVCNEKHSNHEKKFMKQDEINLKVEKNHIEIMTALVRIDTNVTILKEKI